MAKRVARLPRTVAVQGGRPALAGAEAAVDPVGVGRARAHPLRPGGGARLHRAGLRLGRSSYRHPGLYESVVQDGLFQDVHRHDDEDARGFGLAVRPARQALEGAGSQAGVRQAARRPVRAAVGAASAGYRLLHALAAGRDHLVAAVAAPEADGDPPGDRHHGFRRPRPLALPALRALLRGAARDSRASGRAGRAG